MSSKTDKAGISDWRQWIVARPIAHRGLHGKPNGNVENSLAAAHAAIARNFAIECDVQLTKDGQAIVFHDFELNRLTSGKGKVADRKASEIAALTYKDGSGHTPLLAEFLDTIAGRTPVIIELKSDFSGNTTLAQRTAQIVAPRGEPVALKSFDPGLVAFLQQNRAKLDIGHIPLGIVAQASYTHREWAFLSEDARRDLRLFRHWNQTRPDFLSWHVGDLPHPTPSLLRQVAGLPVMTWTVRTQEQLAAANQWADQIIFEETSGLKIE